MSADNIVVFAPPLAELAQQINAATAAAETSARNVVLHALEAGRLLTDAKGQVQRGEWEAWLRQHCTVAPRTAQAYMRLAKMMPMLTDEKRNAVADLPLREAIAAIRTPGAPPPSPPRYRVGLDVASSLRPSLQSAALSLRNLASDVGLKSIKVDRIKALRTKLQAALAALDQIEAK